MCCESRLFCIQSPLSRITRHTTPALSALSLALALSTTSSHAQGACRAATLRSSSTRTGRTAASHFHARRCACCSALLMMRYWLSESCSLSSSIWLIASATAARAGVGRGGGAGGFATTWVLPLERLIKSTSCWCCGDGRARCTGRARAPGMALSPRICRPFFVVQRVFPWRYSVSPSR